jgi:adenylate kinase
MLGAPGTGKGTVAAKLSEKLNIPQVSTGDIFRKAIAEKTPVGVEAEKYISQGMLVPDDVTIKIVEERLKDADVQNGLILDGFPRTIEQAEALDKMLAEMNKEIRLAINLETSEEEIIERIVNRRICSNQDCKAVYNTKLNPPKVEGICDKCGSKLIQRKDDNEETVKNRLQAYYKQSAPIVDFYKNKNLLYSSEVSLKINKMAVDVADEVYELLTK